LLLRADLHRLFDRGYVTVTPDLTFRVSPLLQEQYNNGRIYYALENKKILVPTNQIDQPDREFLAYHSSNIFLAS
jgi:putative restriction endonuclease